jgi:hypothetical protein
VSNSALRIRVCGKFDTSAPAREGAGGRACFEVIRRSFGSFAHPSPG